MNHQVKKQMIEYLNERIFCVIATVHQDGSPEAAFVGYRSSATLEFLIGTSSLSRKYKNLKINHSVAVVVADTIGSVQLEGTAKEISLQEYDELVNAQVFLPLPGIEKYRNDPSQTFFIVEPRWLRFIQHGKSDQIHELTEFKNES